ncbi:transmembrane protein 41B [Eurytemora carolleeae]|uniref:transmembrane protein 41B n=1 Tax=Eurytemora carolleeae TaxID=1294199 RepID=UPI000C78C8B5|nr:transmembrane protein 41B [Eurytemora carolleeae]|eukprot:XP_023342429.1 transmembrane protein 41B-like [Eurytemora affinis]
MPDESGPLQFTKIKDFATHNYNTRLKARRTDDSPVLTDPTSQAANSSSNQEGSVAASSNPEDTTSSSSSGELKTRTAVSLILLIFLSSGLAMFLVYSTFPDVNAADQEIFKFPADIEEAKRLGELLSRYTDKYFAQVYFGFLCTYIFLQTFAIPGSIFLSIISGFLFPFPLALFTVCFCSATGASFCYLLSYLVGRRLVRTYIPDRANDWSKKVDKQRDNLISYILFLRITPFLPNWFINIVSPVIGVPLVPFWVGSFFGVAPPSFVFIQAGTALQQLTSTMDPITFESVGLLVVFALLSLVPVFLKDRLKAKFE